jgi:hypothetical protein
VIALAALPGSGKDGIGARLSVPNMIVTPSQVLNSGCLPVENYDRRRWSCPSHTFVFITLVCVWHFMILSQSGRAKE